MIQVMYAYKPLMGNWKYASAQFYDPLKAARFIYACRSSKNKVFIQYGCDDSDEAEAMEHLVR